jgi:hypothetical protein
MRSRTERAATWPSQRVAAILGSALIILVGLGRGFGGVVLLATAQAPVGDLAVATGHLALMGGALLLVAVLCVWSGVAVLLGKPGGVRVGLVAMALFVIDGAVNGFVLYGAPRPIGLIGNLLVAAIIAALLLRGRLSPPSRRSSSAA